MNEKTQFVHIMKNTSHQTGKTIEDVYIVDGKKVSYANWCNLTKKASEELGPAWHKIVDYVHYNIGPTDYLEAHVNKYVS